MESSYNPRQTCSFRIRDIGRDLPPGETFQIGRLLVELLIPTDRLGDGALDIPHATPLQVVGSFADIELEQAGLVRVAVVARSFD